MSQAWSQFASKDLGVPKGKIKKEKKETTCRKQRNSGTKLCYFSGCFAPSKELYPMAHVQCWALKSLLQPHGWGAACYHTSQAFPGQEGLSWPSISCINTRSGPAIPKARTTTVKLLQPRTTNPAQMGAHRMVPWWDLRQFATLLWRYPGRTEGKGC